MAERQPLLIVVTGPPASGKSGIARALEERLSVPLISKDDIKETLYETVGCGEELEARLEDASLTLLFRIAGRLLEDGYSPVIESDFDRGSDMSRFRALAHALDFDLVQVHVGGDHEELVRRFRERAASGERHPGHEDSADDVDELRTRLVAGLWEPLELGGTLVRVDGTAGEVDVDELVERIRGAARAAT